MSNGKRGVGASKRGFGKVLEYLFNVSLSPYMQSIQDIADKKQKKIPLKSKKINKAK